MFFFFNGLISFSVVIVPMKVFSQRLFHMPPPLFHRWPVAYFDRNEWIWKLPIGGRAQVGGQAQVDNTKNSQRG